VAFGATGLGVHATNAKAQAVRRKKVFFICKEVLVCTKIIIFIIIGKTDDHPLVNNGFVYRPGDNRSL
jgi:hypothetical protein